MPNPVAGMLEHRMGNTHFHHRWHLSLYILIRIALSDQEASFEELSSEHGARNYGCRAAQRCAEITCDLNDSSAEWEFA